MTTITFQPYAPGITDSEGNRIGSIDPRLSRTNYFDGQLLKASDLTRDQIYLDERLLEMGQVLGSGISKGLEVELVDNHILRVQPGIAVAPSGRVLQFSDKPLEINLQDSGLIADLNNGLYRRFNRGLYAIALKYAEVIDGVAEAYPADLASRRKMQVSSYAEGVELALIPLNLTLPRGDEIAIRAALAQQLIGRGGSFDLPTDEAIALGLIAIDKARPLWLDLGLLRRPLRRPNLGNALQLDLATHYSELFEDVLAARHTGGRQNDFAANSYFRLLPPYGPLPKDSIDPVNGRQGYFPKDYEVTIAPVRRADLASIIEESAHLALMDLERDADADIMVLVPMNDQAFALRARQLEKSPQMQMPVINKLPFFNGLSLRLFTQPPTHLIDTDADVWKAIWDEADPKELIYVRRPPRTAETNVSAVVLARGFTLPEITDDLPPDASSLEKQLDQAQEDIIKYKTSLAKNKDEMAAFQKKIDELNSMVGSNIPLNDALAEIQKLKAELAATEEEIKTLQAGAQDTDVFKTALKAATDKIEKLSAELELAYNKIAELQSSTSTTIDEATQKKIKDLIAKLDDANSNAATLANERDEAKVRLAESELALKKLNAELEKLKKKLDELSSGSATNDVDLAAAKEEIDKLKLQVETITKQQQSLQADLLKAQQAQAVAENESKSAILKLSDALKLAQEAQATSNALAQDLSKSKDGLISLQAQLDNAEKKTDELQLQLAQRPSLRAIFPLVEMAKMRGSDIRAAEKLESMVGDNNNARQAVINLLTLIPTNFDKALWPTLVSAADNPKILMKLHGAIRDAFSQGMPLDKTFVTKIFKANQADLNISDIDIAHWMELVG